MKDFKFNNEKHFLGKPCLRGHSGYRFKSTKSCCECAKLYDRKDYLKTYNKNRSSTSDGLAIRILIAARTRQRKKDMKLPFDITRDWIKEKIEKGVCEVSGIKFDLSFNKTLKRPFSPSLDKKDPYKPYTKENCQIVCFIYNIAKGQFSHNDVLKLAQSLTNGDDKPH